MAMASDSDSDIESDAGSVDSDRELQIAFEQGLIKPGLNVETTAPKTFINNVAGLKQALSNLKNDLPWVERLDMTTGLAPAPKAMELEQEQSTSTAPEGDTIDDDFKRELNFYRQAQAAVLEGLPKLAAAGIPTKRPDDYFAEMVKTDNHMKKVREKLLAKKISAERSEKAKKMRELKKYGKKVQQEVLQKRQKEKKDMLEAVKKYRKGKESQLDFLDDMPGQKGKGKAPAKKDTQQFKPNKKREMKNKKFGHGGQKKRSKQNTAASAADMSSFNFKKHGATPSQLQRIKKGEKNRPGKSRRQQMKHKRRKR